MTIDRSEAFDAGVARRLTELAQIWDMPALAGRTEVRVNPRLRTSLGRALPGRWRMELHRALVAADAALIDEVVTHEAAHLVAFARHGFRIRPHGREWAELMRAAGCAPRARHAVELPGLARPARTRTRVEHRCPVCGAGRIARRTVRAWRCRACVEAGGSGRLVITRLEDAPD